jgi:hypothetical protein
VLPGRAARAVLIRNLQMRLPDVPKAVMVSSKALHSGATLLTGLYEVVGVSDSQRLTNAAAWSLVKSPIHAGVSVDILNGDLDTIAIGDRYGARDRSHTVGTVASDLMPFV